MATSRGEPSTLRILLGGKTGSGKSSTMNSLLGNKRCKTGAGSMSVTYKCQQETFAWRNRTVKIMDTPGLYDTSRSPEEIAEKVVDALFQQRPGPHALLFVVNWNSRTTEEETNTFKRLVKYYGEGVLKHTVLVFTHGDDLEEEGLTLDQYVEDGRLSEELSSILAKCGGRRCLVNNKAADNRPFVDDLMDTVLQIFRDNGGRCYENKLPADTAQRLEVAKERERQAEEEELRRKKQFIKLGEQKVEAEEKTKKAEAARLQAESRARQEAQWKRSAQEAAQSAEEGRQREAAARRQAEEAANIAMEKAEKERRKAERRAVQAEEKAEERIDGLERRVEMAEERAEDEGHARKKQERRARKAEEEKERALRFQRESQAAADAKYEKEKAEKDNSRKVARAALRDLARAKRKEAKKLRDEADRLYVLYLLMPWKLGEIQEMRKKADELEEEAKRLEEKADSW